VNSDEQLAAGLMRGSRWSCTSRSHRGLIVEVLAVRSRSVRVFPRGPWSRAQRSNVWMVRIGAFLGTHAPA
jgi:hypothetical protein